MTEAAARHGFSNVRVFGSVARGEETADSDIDLLVDIPDGAGLFAIAAIREHLTRGDLTDGLVFDAVRVRLIEIGEAVKDLPPALLEHEARIPWNEIVGMRDRLAHRYFDTSHAILQATVTNDLPEFEAAIANHRLRLTRER